MVTDMPVDEVDRIFDEFIRSEPVPGLAYGIVVDGELAHAGARGTLQAGTERPPDPDSVFRIASMTKSFTAAALLLLRDEGRIGLDEPVGTYVPELRDLRGPTADSPPVTIRHLMTMSSGLPTDDPWGDRQQGLDLERFREFLRTGFTFARAPGTAFEYSNLGYGILGRVITNVSGTEYRDMVRQRLLEPLGMTASTFVVDDVADDRLARGHLRRDEAFEEVPLDGYGAFASMGGLLTSVRDLARWVGGFCDAFPPRDDPEVGHPLSRATRREMQQAQRTWEPVLSRPSPEVASVLAAGGYGLGLFVFHDLRLGHVVGHSGGYPGFGSNMRWHPGTRIGVVALANRTYVPVGRAVAEALVTLVLRAPASARGPLPLRAAVEARAAVESLLRHWDDAAATTLFAMNVELDEPLERRRAELDRLRATLGELEPDPDEPAESTSPGHLAWWMKGLGGRLHVEILLTPERPPRVQALTLTAAPEPSPQLRELAERIVDGIVRDQPLPEDLRTGPAIDRALLERRLRATGAQFAGLTLRSVIEGDGAASATFRLQGSQGDIDLRLTLDADGSVTRLELVPVTRTAPS